MSDAVKQFISAIGATAEIAGLLYTDLIHEGFSDKQAFTIVKGYVVTALTGKGKETDE